MIKRKKFNPKEYALYLLRWQLSTPILAIVMIIFGFVGTLAATVIANLIGGIIFYWVDRWIFNGRK